MRHVTKKLISKPTLCLGCHCTVRMARRPDAWDCPVCGKEYRIIWWKIKPDKKAEVAA